MIDRHCRVNDRRDRSPRRILHDDDKSRELLQTTAARGALGLVDVLERTHRADHGIPFF
jgi:hypothetical protein